MSLKRPLILVSNDDGIASPGLEALVRAVHPLGDIMVAAPRSEA
jgi:5'-nucleotidase